MKFARAYFRVIRTQAGSLGLAAAIVGECAWTERTDNTFGQPDAKA